MPSKGSYRLAHDSLGEMKIPLDRFWGAQTQRSLENFPIGTEKIPFSVIKALALVKIAAAKINRRLNLLSDQQADLIEKAGQEIVQGKLNTHFPLSVWQTGSGTQSNMNVNEVIAYRGNTLAGQEILHPNDHVNCSQSSNDTFPTAMHLAALEAISEKLLPAIDTTVAALAKLEADYPDLIKIGRTHLQDAVPIKFAQEVSGWRSMLEHNKQEILATLPALREIALGGTAVGTGLNAPAGFAEQVAEVLSELTGEAIVSAPNKMYALAAKDDFVFVHGAIKALAVNWLKIVNDIRWMGSGPRAGLGELQLPANEPGSSIMPGKVNPTQCESAAMVAVQVIGNDTVIGLAASQGNFELNVFLPVCIHNFLQSVNLLSDSLASFTLRCLKGLEPVAARMRANVASSLMLVTALSPHIGYEQAAKVAQYAHANNLTLVEAVVALKLMTADEFNEKVNPAAMV